MSLRDRIEARHSEVLEAEAQLEAEALAKIELKKERQADDSGDNTAVPPDKSCV